MPFDPAPELSVVVPAFNEEAAVLPFLEELARQREVRIELVLSDGGSQDATVAKAQGSQNRLPFPLTIVQGPRGRAGQLNRGAAAACAPTLLFLHIDCSFPDPLALRRGLDALADASAGGALPVAGRFRLQFDFPQRIPLPYRFYGAKAALDRPGCTHGDQGFLLSADLFRRLGPFDTSLPLQEDTFFAERVRQEGRWLLLPASILTSPRRFLSEGLLERQTLNAMLSNLSALGHFALIEELKGCYRSQHRAERLELRPFLLQIGGWIDRLEPAARRDFWYATGSYVRSNAWQIAFFLDVLLGWVTVGKGGKVLRYYDRWLARLLDQRPANWGTALLVKVWFRWLAAR